MRERDIDRKMFHKGHYEVIAARFREQLSRYSYEGISDDAERVRWLLARDALVDLALALAKRFQLDNSDFEPVLFLERCSPDPDMYNIAELWDVGNA